MHNTDPLSAAIIKIWAGYDWMFPCMMDGIECEIGVFRLFECFDRCIGWDRSLTAEQIALVRDPTWRHYFLEAYNHCSNLVNKWKKRPFLVRFLDGDRQNVKLDNLAFVTMEAALDNAASWAVDFETGLSQDEIFASMTPIFTLPVVLDPSWTSCLISSTSTHL